ncbi:hypothetical protein BH10PLA2_BH10PLA2_12800 [soil metagenome]
MDRLRELLVELKRDKSTQGNFLGLLNVLIGSTIETAAGEAVSSGTTWRHLAEMLKKVRWSKDSADELGIELGSFAPRDRQRFWYQVISHAAVDSPQAREAGIRIIEVLRQLGYRIKGSTSIVPPANTG